MLNSFLEFYQVWQKVLLEVCLVALGILMLIPLGKFFSDGWHELEKFFGKLDNLGKFVAVCALCVFGYVGSTKHYVNDPPKVGADSHILLEAFDVEYNTNNVPPRTEITIVWTNNVTGMSPPNMHQVAYREAASNDWNIITSIEHIDFGSGGGSNYWKFAVSGSTNDLSKMTHWWWGTDLPATEIIVISDDLKITEFTHTSEYIDITIGISEDLYEIFRRTDEDDQFIIQYSDDDGAHWVDVARTRELYIRIPGFWYGKDRYWRVIFEYSSGKINSEEEAEP